MSAIAMMQRSWEHVSIEAEARRICDDKGIESFETFQQICRSLAHAEFMRSIEPLLKLKSSFYFTRILDKIVMDKDGKVERVEYKPFPEETQKALDQLDAMIANEATRYGLNAPSPTPEAPDTESS
jgi:hypothetical protein